MPRACLKFGLQVSKLIGPAAHHFPNLKCARESKIQIGDHARMCHLHLFKQSAITHAWSDRIRFRCQYTGNGRKVVVIHSARSLDELMLIAPLLQHSDVFDLRLFYTGVAIHIDSKQTRKVPKPLASRIRRPVGGGSWPGSPLATLESINSNARAPLVRQSSQQDSEALVMSGQQTGIPRSENEDGVHNSEVRLYLRNAYHQIASNILHVSPQN